MKVIYYLIGLAAIAIGLFTATQSVGGEPKFPIRGNAPQMVYHLQECPSYFSVVIRESEGDRIFLTEKEAQDAGFRKANNCP